MSGTAQPEWDEDVPPEVLDRIASAVLEELDRTGGDASALDVPGLKARFPGFEAAVESHVESLRAATRPSSTVGPFRLGRPLGRGATSTVFEAWDSRLERRVALKILKTDEFEEDRPRIEREVAIQRALRHPGIVEFYEFARHDGKTCIAMELVPGVSLSRLIHAARSGDSKPGDTTLHDLITTCLESGPSGDPAPDSPTQIVAARAADPAARQSLGGQYFRDVALAIASAAEALDHAHCLGLVHRDIKPGNLLVDRDGAVKVADFGLAKGRGFLHLTQTGRFVGTPYYASPEQASRYRKVGSASYIWSLGVTLYELVTLSVPFCGENVEQVLARIQRGRFLPPRKHNPRIPRDLERIILRCLERYPGFRYATAGQLAQDLYRFAGGEAVELRTIPPWRRAWHAVKHPTPPTLLKLTTAFVLVWIAGWGSLAIAEASARETRFQSRVGIVHRFLDSFRRVRDADILRQAGELAMETMIAEPERVEAQRELLRTLGSGAWERNQWDRAASLLSEAHEIDALEGDDLLNLARAAFAAGQLAGAEAAYNRLPPTIRADEGSIVKCFRDAHPLPCAVTKALAPARIDGLAPGTVLVLEPVNPPQIRVFPGGLLSGEIGAWDPPETVADSHTNHTDLTTADLDGDGDDEVVLAADDRIFVAEGPFSAVVTPEWHDLGNPFEEFLDFGGYRNNVHIAVVPRAGPDASDAALFVSRYRCVARLQLEKKNERWRARRRGVVPELCGADVLVLKSIMTDGRPGLLSAFGPWGQNGFSVRRFGLDRVGHVVPEAAATLGTPLGLVSHRPPGSDCDLVIVYLGGPEFYTDYRRFGMTSPNGWECGVHALRGDPETGAFAPVASLALPRPLQARATLSLCDVIGDAAPEILVSRWLWEGASEGEPALKETLVIRIHTRAEGVEFQDVLRLPGAVTAVVPRPKGGSDIVLDQGPNGYFAVRMRP